MRRDMSLVAKVPVPHSAFLFLALRNFEEMMRDGVGGAQNKELEKTLVLESVGLGLNKEAHFLCDTKKLKTVYSKWKINAR